VVAGIMGVGFIVASLMRDTRRYSLIREE